MGRTKLSPNRLSEIKKINLGHIIIFCEGETEECYFKYFSDIISKNKYSSVKVVLTTAKGNAQTVLNYADSFMNEEKNMRLYSNFEKYIAFDCDDPKDIQAVILKTGGYELLISNYLFETWLLMHFEQLNAAISKKATYKQLSNHLVSKYTKGDRGTIREIIQNGSIENAITNAQKLENKYREENKSVFSDINSMNPYTSVYKLVEQFMVEISY